MNLHIEPTDLAGRLASPTPPRLLDVREPEEHAFAALPGARLIPLGQLADRTEELDDWRNEDIVVYCHHGIRSQHGMAILRHAGFQRLLNLRGGIDRWSIDVDPALPRY